MNRHLFWSACLAGLIIAIVHPRAGAQDPIEPQPAPESEQTPPQADEKPAESPPAGALRPLPGSRHLSFDVREGTWMSLDVHPQGDRIVFDLLGDLYTLPIGGGRAERITSGIAFDSQPVFSPDGTRIAFISDRSGNENVWVMNADGTDARQISFDTNNEAHTSPAWSAEGKTVYVSRKLFRREEFGLYAYALAGGSGVRIEDDVEPSSEIIDVEPSTDGRYLYYSGKSRAAPTLYYIPAWNVYRRDLRTGATEELVTSPGGALRPVLSPDGRTLVYGTRFDGNTGLRVRDLVTGEDRWLVYPVDLDAQSDTVSRGHLPGYSFLPSGEALIVSYGGQFHRIDLASGRDRGIPFTAHVDLQIGPALARNVPIDTGPVRARLIQAPKQSADGRRLAFSALSRLYVAELPNGQPRRLTNDEDGPGEFEPAWSPDGRTIAYVTWTAAEGGHVWKVRPGGKPMRLTKHAAFYSDPVFSPDGRFVYAFRSNNRERLQLQEEVTPHRHADLVRIPVDGGDTSVVLNTGLGAHRLFVTADPRRVYYTNNDGEVVSVRGDANEGEGTDLRKHVRLEGLHPWSSPGRPMPLSKAVLSPDGQWLLTSMANQLYLVAVPPASHEPAVINLIEAPKWPHAQVSRFGADYFDWADGGKTITWAVGATFFRRSLDSIDLDAAKTGVPAEPAGSVEQITMRVEVPRDVPNGKLLLRGGTAITMRGEEVIENADVLIVNDRIAAIGARGTFEIPADAQVRDVSGHYLLPGFIDTHAHWYEVRHNLLDSQNWSFLTSLAYGVTAGLDVQAMDQDMFAYQDLVDAGRMIGPRVFSVGQGLFANNALRSLEQTNLLLQRYRDYYRTPNVKSYLIGNRGQRRWVVEAAHATGLLPTTEGGGDLELDITHALDGFHGNEHALTSGRIYEDVVQLFARSRVSYTPTLMIASGWPSVEKHRYIIANRPHDDPKVRRFMPHYVIDRRTSPIEWVRDEEWVGDNIGAGAARIMRAGGRIGVGSHAEFQGPIYHWELQALASGGMTPHEVLTAATRHGSEIIGRADELGTLEAGKYADLQILAKNPLADIRNTLAIRQIMKNGRLYDADTLDEVWPRQRPLPPLWFWNEVPPGAPQPGPNPIN